MKTVNIRAAVVGLALGLLGGAIPVCGGDRPWPMLGGTPQRNLVNLTDKNLPTDWCLKRGKLRNVQWAAELGSTSWGTPVIAGGKVFIGTNNDRPRDPALKGDKGVLMCFRESGAPSSGRSFTTISVPTTMTCRGRASHPCGRS